ncbi:tyrosine-type recombinase/integrase [Streptomyces sp. NPDC101776]|uniref:tyrosine-type recombinase/integrase n=1 Tax=Streptomyces sp. NPDC101776 TaxID=3366146 RepID=UPI0037FAE3F6
MTSNFTHPAGLWNSPDALRHLYASMMINGGVDVYTLADRLGHADPAFTLRKYVHRIVGAGSKVRIAVRSAYSRAA